MPASLCPGVSLANLKDSAVRSCFPSHHSVEKLNGHNNRWSMTGKVESGVVSSHRSASH